MTSVGMIALLYYDSACCGSWSCFIVLAVFVFLSVLSVRFRLVFDIVVNCLDTASCGCLLDCLNEGIITVFGCDTDDYCYTAG